MATGFPILFGGSRLWTPASISTAQWFDAADASTITLNGSTVSQWADKSGNGRHMTQSTASLQPTWAVSSFSLPSVNFVAHEMISNAISATNSDFTIYSVTKQTKTTTANNDSMFSTRQNVNGSFQIASNGTQLVATGTNLTGGFITNLFDNSIAANYRIIRLESSATDVKTYLNATLAATSAGSSFNASPTLGFQLGRNRGGGLYLWADHAEWIVILGVPSPATSDRVEGYLAWRWGQQGLLPANHPYKNAPPRG